MPYPTNPAVVIGATSIHNSTHPPEDQQTDPMVGPLLQGKEKGCKPSLGELGATSRKTTRLLQTWDQLEWCWRNYGTGTTNDSQVTAETGTRATSWRSWRWSLVHGKDALMLERDILLAWPLYTLTSQTGAAPVHYALHAKTHRQKLGLLYRTLRLAILYRWSLLTSWACPPSQLPAIPTS